MPPFDLLNTNDALLTVAVGIGLAVLIILARNSTHFTFSLRRRPPEKLGKVHEFPSGLAERDSAPPIFIWLVFLALVVWSVGYVLFSGAHGL
jgi:hypothetical protein